MLKHQKFNFEKEEKQLLDLKILAEEIAKMLSGLISYIKRSFSPNSELRTPN